MTTAKSEAQAGDFTITCTLTRAAAEFYDANKDNSDGNEAPKPVVLSVDQETPATYVLLNGNKTVAQKPTDAVWAAEYAVKIDISYDGSAASHEEVEDQWKTAISTKDLVITTTASGGLAGVVRYVTSASNLATLADGNIKTVSNSDAKNYSFSGSGSSWSVTQQNLGNIYVALTGSDGDQDSLLSAAATVLTPAFSLSV